MRRRRLPLAEIGVSVAALASAIVLAGMLASPLIPTATPSPLPTPAPATPAPSDVGVPLPMGLYVARDPLSIGPCIAIELSPESYAVVADHGTATVRHWERGMTGCDTRSGDVVEVVAEVTAVVNQGGPRDGEIGGYNVAFLVPLSGGRPDAPMVNAEIAFLLPDVANAPILQAVEGSGSGFGHVLDRATQVAPSLVPIPTPAG